ncbi:MAG: BatA domain-containing protein [Flavobacteriaceae bacterium]|nr:BatA domain-containing protein [Flavobacteriaceae bacterium]
MQFKYPEFFYALFLLLIPIIVHLFQLRRFEKVAFTNVDFLKKLTLQTRKSSKLKQFLILLSRLFLLAALIFAFAQPFFSKNKTNVKPQTLLYLDNSLSMQAKDGNNELLKKAVQAIISDFSVPNNITVLTNTELYKNLSAKELKNKLLSLEYHPVPQNLTTVLLKVNNAFHNGKKKNIKNHVVLISDFQKHTLDSNLKLNHLTDYSFVQLLPQKKANISIDSVFIAAQNANEITLKVQLKSYNASNENLSISLFKDHILVGKASAVIKKDKITDVSFRFPFNANFNGTITIEDNLIPFDNTLYFSLNKVAKIKVLGIGTKNTFLSKIYTNSEFDFSSKKINQLDYNQINTQHLIILNELDKIPNSLQKTLKDFIFSGGSLVVIPSLKLDLSNYNQFFNLLKIGSINTLNKNERKVTTINFSHNILAKVFEKQIKNFQYPNIKSSYSANFKNASSILKLDNQQAFISQTKINNGNLYYVTGAINTKNSNFKNSPLIVPVFYNFGKQSFNLTDLYYTVGKPTVFEVETEIKKETVLQLKNDEVSFIPLQQISQGRVKITTEENPLQANHYQIFNGKKAIKNIAYNYDRAESNTQYANIVSKIKASKNAHFSTNINQAFTNIQDKYQTKPLWKGLVILAILFLIIEMLLIKFWK